MAVLGRSSGNQSAQQFSAIADELGRAAVNFGSLVGSGTLLGTIVNSFRNLERELVLTNSVADGTSAQFKDMQKSVRDFALASRFSAAEAANSLYDLASAGFSVEESVAAMSGVLTLAQATLKDVGFIADLVASSIRAFGLEAKDASRVSNVLTAIAAKSQATVERLAFAFRLVGPAAASAGLSIETTSAYLGELFNIGLRGEQAGTQLRNIIVRLQNPVGEAAQVLGQLGISTIDTSGHMRDLGAVLKEISEKNIDQATLSILSGTEALVGFTALLKSVKSGSFDELRRSITGTQLASKIALDQMNTLDGSFKRASNSATELALSFGEQLAPELKKILDGFSSLVLSFREMPNDVKQLVTTFVGFTATVIGLTFAVKGLFALLNRASPFGALLGGGRGRGRGGVGGRLPRGGGGAARRGVQPRGRGGRFRARTPFERFTEFLGNSTEGLRNSAGRVAGIATIGGIGLGVADYFDLGDIFNQIHEGTYGQLTDFEGQEKQRLSDIQLQTADPVERFGRINQESQGLAGKLKEYEIDARKTSDQLKEARDHFEEEAGKLFDADRETAKKIVDVVKSFGADSVSGLLRQFLDTGSTSGIAQYLGVPSAIEFRVKELVEGRENNSVGNIVILLGQTILDKMRDAGIPKDVQQSFAQLIAKGKNEAADRIAMLIEGSGYAKGADVPDTFVKTVIKTFNEAVLGDVNNLVPLEEQLKALEAHMKVLGKNTDSVVAAKKLVDKKLGEMFTPQAAEDIKTSEKSRNIFINHQTLREFTIGADQQRTALEKLQAQLRNDPSLSYVADVEAAQTQREQAIDKLNNKFIASNTKLFKTVQSNSSTISLAQVLNSIVYQGKDPKKVLDEIKKDGGYSQSNLDDIEKLVNAYISERDSILGDAKTRVKLADQQFYDSILRQAQQQAQLGQGLQSKQIEALTATVALNPYDVRGAFDAATQKIVADADKALANESLSLTQAVKDKLISQEDQQAILKATEEAIGRMTDAQLSAARDKLAEARITLPQDLRQAVSDYQTAMSKSLVDIGVFNGGQSPNAAGAFQQSLGRARLLPLYAQLGTLQKSRQAEVRSALANAQQNGPTLGGSVDDDIEAINAKYNEGADIIQKRIDLEKEFQQTEEFRVQSSKQQIAQEIASYRQLHQETGNFFEGFALAGKNAKNTLETDLAVGEQFFGQVRDDLGNFVGDWLTTNQFIGANFKQTLFNMLSDWANFLARAASRKAVTALFDWALPSLGLGSVTKSARGNIFHDGAMVQMFAYGGVMDQPFAFPMRNGNIGVGAEKDSEAIMPLVRTKSGHLGVRSVGDGGSSVFAPQISVAVTVTGAQAGSQNAGQKIGKDVAAFLDQMMDAKIAEYMRKERRFGGQFNDQRFSG